jgi:hypothetical protein
VDQLGKFDLVYAAGPYDHLNRWTATRLTEALFRGMRPGGLLLVTNFVQGIRDAGYMEAFMDWHLNFRNAKDMFSLASSLPEDQIADRRTFSEERRHRSWRCARSSTRWKHRSGGVLPEP